MSDNSTTFHETPRGEFSAETLAHVLVLQSDLDCGDRAVTRLAMPQYSVVLGQNQDTDEMISEICVNNPDDTLVDLMILRIRIRPTNSIPIAAAKYSSSLTETEQKIVETVFGKPDLVSDGEFLNMVAEAISRDEDGEIQRFLVSAMSNWRDAFVRSNVVGDRDEANIKPGYHVYAVFKFVEPFDPTPALRRHAEKLVVDNELSDLFSRQRSSTATHQALDNLTRQAQDLNLGYGQ